MTAPSPEQVHAAAVEVYGPDPAGWQLENAEAALVAAARVTAPEPGGEPIDACVHGPGVMRCGHPDCVGAREFGARVASPTPGAQGERDECDICGSADHEALGHDVARVTSRPFRPAPPVPAVDEQVKGVTVDQHANATYIRLGGGRVARTTPGAAEVNLDVDADGYVLGIEVLAALRVRPAPPVDTEALARVLASAAERAYSESMDWPDLMREVVYDDAILAALRSTAPALDTEALANCVLCGHAVHGVTDCDEPIGYDHLNGDHECACPGVAPAPLTLARWMHDHLYLGDESVETTWDDLTAERRERWLSLAAAALRSTALVGGDGRRD